MKNAAFLLAALPVSIGGCTIPDVVTQSTRLTESSSISLTNAPDGATIRVADRSATAREGVAMLYVPDGWHEVAISSQGRVVKTMRVFLQDGTSKKIDFSTLQ